MNERREEEEGKESALALDPAPPLPSIEHKRSLD